MTSFPSGPDSLVANFVDLAAAGDDLIVVAESEVRAARLHAAAVAQAPDLDILLLPAWDWLPCDRASPSRDIMGRRMAVLQRLLQGASRTRVLIASVDAIIQRLPPHSPPPLVVRRGEPLDVAGFTNNLGRWGYLESDVVDSPGELAVRTAVLDVFSPGDTHACRIELADGEVAALRHFDPVTQRSDDEVDAVAIRPASELILAEDAEVTHAPGIEHGLADFHDEPLVSVFALLPAAHVLLDPEAEALFAQRSAEIDESCHSRLARAAGQHAPSAAYRKLYLEATDWQAMASRHRVSVLEAAAEPAQASAADPRPAGRRSCGLAEAATLRPGDAVVHIEHGVAALRGVEHVETGSARFDCLRLEYAGGTTSLVPFDEMSDLWRYGGDADSVALDRLGSDQWQIRRAEVEAQIESTAEELARRARERAQSKAAVLKPTAAYRRFAANFPYETTADQEAAIAEVLHDLASGRPMDRLVCGDVGFGKTEVALRAACVAALAGKQVAVLVPTTVLVRQHFENFSRRFGRLGIRLASLSRLSSAGELRETRRGLADGSIGIVIGTQALAGKEVRFRDLGLVIIDEEHRFGARQKSMVARLGAGTHVLTMTATPIPRTLQTALVGLQDLSVIATPPAARQPVRTVQAPFGETLLREALVQEHRRGGQSFVVCPRIQDLEPLQEQIARLLPHLGLIQAHGGMKAEDIDDAMIRFANHEADVLLATDIVEAGLDVPRANTMLVCHADRFGLAQLHQLRGRVGRGRRRGCVYLTTDPASKLGAATRKRLDSMEALDRVGAGFAISARDMDLRGAGDLLGQEQAGHVKLIGLELYQHQLSRALARMRGEPMAEEWTPVLSLEMDAHVPPDYVADHGLRVELFARLARILRSGEAQTIDDLAEEIADRYGPPPPAVEKLLERARLQLACRRLGIARLEVGPNAAAASFRAEPPPARSPLERRGDRLVLPASSPTQERALATAREFLARVA